MQKQNTFIPSFSLASFSSSSSSCLYKIKKTKLFKLIIKNHWKLNSTIKPKMSMSLRVPRSPLFGSSSDAFWEALLCRPDNGHERDKEYWSCNTSWLKRCVISHITTVKRNWYLSWVCFLTSNDCRNEEHREVTEGRTCAGVCIICKKTKQCFRVHTDGTWRDYEQFYCTHPLQN